MVAGWTSNVASRHAGAMRAASPIVKRCHGVHRAPPRELSLRHDELLPEQRVLGDGTGAAAHDVGGQAHHEPKDVDHAARGTAASARIPIVARTGELSLGTAIAISGAAVSPNMGSSTPSAALALLMTFLNLRLGFWAPTPDQSDWRSPQARMWPFYLLKESLSQTNDLTMYCYLTDGATSTTRGSIHSSSADAATSWRSIAAPIRRSASRIWET